MMKTISLPEVLEVLAFLVFFQEITAEIADLEKQRDELEAAMKKVIINSFLCVPHIKKCLMILQYAANFWHLNIHTTLQTP